MEFLDTIGTLLAAIAAFLGILFTIYKWYTKRKDQDKNNSREIRSKPTFQNTQRLISLRNILVDDFSKEGPHSGEFGTTASEKEQGSWAQGGPDKVAIKPWYYLTYWAVRGLKVADPSYLSTIVPIICRGIDLRVRERWIKVEVVRNQSYDTVPGEKENLVVNSYRHTLRAANILLAIASNHELVEKVILDFLNDQLSIQNDDGGWPQCDNIYTSSDLWASSYFLRFTNDLRNQNHPLFKRHENKITISQMRTLDFLIEEWKSSRWDYREMPPSVSVPKLLIEIFTDHYLNVPEHIVSAFYDQCRGQLTTTGYLIDSNEVTNKGISEAQQLIRLSLAMELITQNPTREIRTFHKKVANNGFDMLTDLDRIGPEDASFSIHLHDRFDH